MAFDAYLKIDGITGECTAKDHQNQIKITGYSHGVQQRLSGDISTAGYRTGGGCTHGFIRFTKQLDLASPALYMSCSQGKNHASAEFAFYRAGGDRLKYLTVKLTNVNIASISVAQSENDQFPLEEVELAYAKIEWEYSATKSDASTGGSSTGSWNLEAHDVN